MLAQGSIRPVREGSFVVSLDITERECLGTALRERAAKSKPS